MPVSYSGPPRGGAIGTGGTVLGLGVEPRSRSSAPGQNGPSPIPERFFPLPTLFSSGLF